MKYFRSLKKVQKLRISIKKGRNLRKQFCKKTISNFESNTINNNLSPEECLINVGIIDYITPTFTGQSKNTAIKTFMTRLILFLNWGYKKLHHIPIRGSDNVNILELFSLLIAKHYNIIADFVKYLKNKKGLSNCTQRNYLIDIAKAVDWFSLFRDNCETEFPIRTKCLQKWKKCLKIVKKPITKAISLDIAKAKSLEDKIYDGIFPENGLIQLKQCIDDEMEYIKSFKTENDFIDKTTYITFMRILYSSLYACGIQGRLSGNVFNISFF